ncbi:MAG: hypothetical protein P8J50_15310 [Acidimicrobiales bacterium]|nr:hypothetical protein [Acidimicrobiales bacterium]
MNSAADDLDPASLEGASFDLVRRGFDPTAVRAELQLAAQEIRRLRLARDELTGRLAEYKDVTADHLEAHQVAEALGVEATQVLEAAHLAAKERAERAEREADAVRDEALAAADTTRAEAQAARDELAAQATKDAELIVEDGRTRGRDMVAEAQAVRERMLKDLARKRQTGRAQVEQLRAGRDRLLESLTIAQGSLDTAVDDLVTSVPEARSAAERAGMRVTSEPTPTADELEREIESARLVGHPLVDDLSDPASVDEIFATGEVEALSHLDDVLDEGAEGDAEDESTADESSDDEDVALYDVEAEDDAPEPQPEAEPEDDPEPDGNAVDDVFAKLRSAQSDEDADTEPEPDPEPEPEPEPESAPDAVSLDDDRAAARERAADAATKAMKKVLVDEQGTLLDGIRRSGAAGLSIVIDDDATHRAPYDAAARPALKELSAELGGSKRSRLAAAFGQIDALALAPVRQRLREVAEHVDDADELSDTVRALYRESRDRRLVDAAAAAAVAVDGMVVVAATKGSVQWRVATDGPCGPDCADNELEGAVKAGSTFPTGDKHPPSHPGCTCWLEFAD